MENETTPTPLDDWRPGVAEKLRHYVYLLIDPRTARPFYVGKGVGDRCFAHIAHARRTTADAVGDYPKLATIRDIESQGDRVRIEVLSHDLEEPVALAVEAAAINLLGLKDLTNSVAGHHHRRLRSEDVNAQYGAVPIDLDPLHRVVLIRVTRRFNSSMSDDELYEATRKWWRVGPLRRQIGSPRAPDWAFTVHEGVVRAAFRIEGWSPAEDSDIAQDEKRRGRWCFVGKRDPEVENRYRFADVTAHLPRAAQTPLRFVNCGKELPADKSADGAPGNRDPIH